MVAAPKWGFSSSSRSRVGSLALASRRLKNTLGRAVITWKCLPMGSTLRNTSTVPTWVQKKNWRATCVPRPPAVKPRRA